MRETITVALFVIGNLIGAGFFMMPATVAPLGMNLIWSWSAGVIIALAFALIFGRLYDWYPEAETLSDYFDQYSLKQSVAILYWVGAIVGNVVLLTMVIAALKPSSFIISVFGAFCAMLVLTLINHFLCYETVESIEVFLSVLKFSLLIFLPLFIFFSDPYRVTLPSAQGSFNDIIKMGALSFWAFLGIETAGVFGKGDSAKRGLLIGIIACFVLYVLSCFLIVGSVSLNVLKDSKEIPLVLLIRNSKFPGLSKYVSVLISFTCFGSLYGWVAATSKMSLSYAKNNVFPKVFLLETRSHNSVFGLWSSSIVTFIIYVFVCTLQVGAQFEMIADFCVNITLFIFCLCAYVLFSKSVFVFDQLLSVFGFVFVGFLLSMNLYFSVISFVLFGGTLCFSYLMND